MYQIETVYFIHFDQLIGIFLSFYLTYDYYLQKNAKVEEIIYLFFKLTKLF